MTEFTDDMIAVGDYVVPDDEYADVVTPCQVRAVYKNGNLYARSNDGRVSWRGQMTAFRMTDRRT